MAHKIFLVDGLPEGIQFLERNLDRHGFGVGTARLREIKIYDLQYDSRDQEQVNKWFARHCAKSRKFKDGLGYKFKKKTQDFQHGRFRAIINILMGTFGKIIGIKPFKMAKEFPQEEQNPIPVLVNIYPIFEAEDNFILDKKTGKVREYL